MTKKLKTLEEHNKLVLDLFYNKKTTNKNGISCPNCKEELSDDRGYVLTSYPPKYKIFCEQCGWKGSRYI